MVKARTAEGGL